VAEWLKAHAWKVCLGLNLTWVRIPPPPPNINNPLNCGFFMFGAGRIGSNQRFDKNFGKVFEQAPLGPQSGRGHGQPEYKNFGKVFEQAPLGPQSGRGHGQPEYKNFGKVFEQAPLGPQSGRGHGQPEYKMYATFCTGSAYPKRSPHEVSGSRAVSSMIRVDPLS
jgi:hypothetical protein